MAVRKNDKVYVSAGAGIVADSIPENEFNESRNKARAMFEALDRAQEVE
jgi:anthranilate synthase component 1